MDDLFHGKSQSEMDDDLGVALFWETSISELVTSSGFSVETATLSIADSLYCIA